jgi:RNA polymerase sigma-70 factor (ECF subfamily)
VAATFRRESPGVVATLTCTVGDLGVAEDAVQDAFVAALERWPVDGIPDRPGAWIVTTARHKAFDRLRRESKRDRKHLDAHRSLAALDGWDQPHPSTVRDDMLRLVFICCHPVLPAESRVALALRTLCGLRTEEVARLLLASPVATGQRIVRAKRKLADAEVRFELPTTQDMPDRLPAVLATIHLLFTEGHTSSASDAHVRADVCAEAVRLSGLLAELMPDEPEVLGLQALLLLTHARRATRVDDRGDLVVLADQARDRWEGEEIERGVELVESALRRGRAGRYQLEAAIAACHATAPSFEATDWVEIASLYALLEGVAPSPVVLLNRAVAVGQAFGPEAGLEVLDTLAGGLDGHHLRWAVEADLHRRSQALAPAVACYRRALECAPNAAERRFLQMRMDELEAP